MKILRCFVENFGVISKESFDFDKELSCIYKENGRGKTTLFVFIKAMLFGLEASTRRALDENERNKYRPWNGGRYGGWLEFSRDSDGVSYRVTRFFGEKESLDTFEVIDLSTGLDAKDAFESSNIGLCLLGIDADGFERTLFLSERDLEIKNSGSLTQKISALASGEDESFESAVKILDNKRKYYKNNQNRGYLTDLEEKLRQKNCDLEELLIKSENIKRLEDELGAQKSQLDELTTKKAELESLSQCLSQALMVRSKQNATKTLTDRLGELTLEKQRICEKYKNERVSAEDAKNVREGIDKLQKLLAQSSTHQGSELKNRISAVEERIAGLEIQKDEIPSLLKKYSDAQSVDLESLKTQREKAYSQYENCKNSLPSEPFYESELEKVKNIKAKILTLEGEKNALTDKYLELSRKNGESYGKNADKKAFSALCFALVSVIFATLALTVSPWLWIAFGVSVCAFAVLGVSAMKQRSEISSQKHEHEREKSELDARIRDVKETIADLESQSSALEQKYAKYGDISGIRERFELCAELEHKCDEISQKYADEKARVERVQSELENRLSPYLCHFEDADMGQILISLSGDLERLELLRSNLDAANDQQNARNAQIKDAENELLDLINTLLCESVEDRGLAAATSVYNMMMLDISSIPRLENEISELGRSIDNANVSPLVDSVDAIYLEKDENQLSSELDTTKNELLVLDQKRESVNSVIGKLESALDVLYDRCEDIPQLEQEIEELSEKARVAEEEFNTVVKTKEYLEKAKNSLMSRYLGAIQDNFLDVFGKITANENEAVKLDAKLALKLEREGTLRDMQYFSRGMRDIMDFALRMALVKTLFNKEEAPFILLDDPFASLDEKHLEIAKGCVSEIAGEYQVIYTVCNEDRKINI